MRSACARPLSSSLCDSSRAMVRRSNAQTLSALAPVPGRSFHSPATGLVTPRSRGSCGAPDLPVRQLSRPPVAPLWRAPVRLRLIFRPPWCGRRRSRRVTEAAAASVRGAAQSVTDRERRRDCFSRARRPRPVAIRRDHRARSSHVVHRALRAFRACVRGALALLGMVPCAGVRNALMPSASPRIVTFLVRHRRWPCAPRRARPQRALRANRTGTGVVFCVRLV